MTVKQLTQIERYVGPSTATKPLDCSIGSTFLEEDTSRLFVFDGTGWFPKTQDIVIYDAEGNPLEIEGGRMKVSVDASVVAPEEVVWSNITLRDGQNPSNKLAVLPDGSLKVQLPGSENFAKDLTIQEVTSELELVKAELQTIKANQLSGDQKVTLSGTIVEQGEVARDVIVTPGSEVIAYTDGNKLAAVALSVVVNAKTPHDFSLRVIERVVSIPGYSSIYFDTNLLSEGKVMIAMPKKALSANWSIQYRIRNSSDIDQSYAIARGLWNV